MTRVLGLVIVAISCLEVAACCPAPVERPEPEQLVGAYVRAVEGQRYAEAAALLASRTGQDADSMRAFWTGPESQPAREALAAVAAGELELKSLQARVQGAAGEILLERDASGHWRLAQGDILPAQASGPKVALARFIAAIEAGDCGALAQEAPPGIIRTHGLPALEDGCRRQLEQLKAHVDDLRKAASGLRSAGPGRQEAPFGERGRLILAQEAGRWYILDY